MYSAFASLVLQGRLAQTVWHVYVCTAFAAIGVQAKLKVAEDSLASAEEKLAIKKAGRLRKSHHTNVGTLQGCAALWQNVVHRLLIRVL